MKRWIVGALFVVLAALVVVPMVEGSYTKNYSRVDLPAWGGSWLRFTHTWIARNDTAYFPVVLPHDLIKDSVLYVSIATAKVSTDSAISFGVRWQASMDNSTWTAVKSIGTDSTTWYASATTYTQTPLVKISFPTYSYGVYGRLMILGYGTGTVQNGIGNKVRVDFLFPNK